MARLVLGEAAAAAGVPLAHIPDVRLCVDEAFGLALRRHAAAAVADPVVLHFGPDGRLWRVRVRDATPAGVVSDLALQVIRALPDEVRLAADEEGLGIDMSWLTDPDGPQEAPAP